jgi:tetratricopeptide (TPR) repeat protein
MLKTIGEIETAISAFRHQGEIEDAEAICRLYLKQAELSLGVNAPETLTLLHRLGDILHERKYLHEALDMTIKAIQGREKRLGILHIETLKSVSNFGNILWDLGRITESETAIRRAYEGFSSTLGPEHFYTLKSMHNLLLFLNSHGQVDKSYSLLEQDLMRRISVAEDDFTLYTNRVIISDSIQG